MNKLKKPELLAPASNLYKLKIAIDYGADAVYIGGQDYSLRANAENFSIEQIKEACDYAHSKNSKVYVTTNILFHDKDINEVEDFLKKIKVAGVDAVMLADPFLIPIIKEKVPDLNIYISTQQSSMNTEAVKFFEEEGAERVVLGRETTKEEIEEIIKNTNIGIEIFIHGSMCMSYSGRCTLSNHMTGRDSNRGGCIGICRWEWPLLDESGNEIDKNTMYSMSAKDLNMIKHIPELIELGVDSLKVEGRMRSEHYIGTIINMYRRLIDNYIADPENFKIEDFYFEEPKKCANRESITQYFDKEPNENHQYYHTSGTPSNKTFIGVIKDYKDGKALVEERNKFSVGDEIEVFGPDTDNFTFKIEYIINSEGERVENAPNPKELFWINMPKEVHPADMIRIK
jgi:putative protease